jgi:hypothetical protein
VCVRDAFERVQASSNACVQCSACVKGRCGRTHQGKVERSAVYTFERIGIRSNAESNIKTKKKKFYNFYTKVK